MVPGKANQRVIADRLDWVQRMTDEIRALPLESLAVCHLHPGDCGSAGRERCLLELAEEASAMCRHRPVKPVQLPFYPCHRITFNLKRLFTPPFFLSSSLILGTALLNPAPCPFYLVIDRPSRAPCAVPLFQSSIVEGVPRAQGEAWSESERP